MVSLKVNYLAEVVSTHVKTNVFVWILNFEECLVSKLQKPLVGPYTEAHILPRAGQITRLSSMSGLSLHQNPKEVDTSFT